METTIVYWGYIGIMEKKVETTIVRRPWGACWMVAEGGEGENPLPFSLTKRGGWVGGGGVGGVCRLRFPPGPHLRSSRFRLGSQGLGARAPGPLETWPTGARGLDSHRLTSCFLTSCGANPLGPGPQNPRLLP